MNDNGNDLLTMEEFAAMARTSLDTARYWVYVGKAPRSIKIGKRRLFRRADCEQWVEDHFADAS
jgi:predicted DNA-binding transcriptional regulator AlpA